MRKKIKIPKVVEFAEHHHITPGTVLLVAVSFWVTVFLTRGIIFWSVINGAIPAIIIKGFHIHHFITGFLLLAISSFLMSRHIFSRYVPLALIGCSLGLVFDEFLFWTRGHFNYWSTVNLIAVTIIGTCLVVTYVYVKRYDPEIMKKLLNHPASTPRLITALLPVLFVVITLVLMFTYDGLPTIEAIKASVPPQPTSIEQISE